MQLYIFFPSLRVKLTSFPMQPFDCGSKIITPGLRIIMPCYAMASYSIPGTIHRNYLYSPKWSVTRILQGLPATNTFLPINKIRNAIKFHSLMVLTPIIPFHFCFYLRMIQTYESDSCTFFLHILNFSS